MSYKSKPSQSFDVVKGTTGHIGTLYVGGDPLNGVEGTALSGTELAYLDSVTPGTVSASKVVIVDANKRIDTIVVAASGLKIGTGAGTAVTATAAELNKNAGVTAGTATASKTAVLGAYCNLDKISLPAGGLKIGSTTGGTAVSCTAAELNKLNGVTAGTATASKAAVLGTNCDLNKLSLPVSGLRIGTGAGTVVARTAAELNALVAGAAAGYRINRGSTAGTGTVTCATGLTTVVAFLANAVGDGTGTKANQCVSTQTAISTTNGLVYRFKHTGATTPTLVASTVAGTVSWVAIGT